MTQKDIRPAQTRVDVSVGESVRIVRELQGLTESELARRTMIPQSTISAIENDTINLGVERAKTWRASCGAIPPFWCSPAGT